MLGVVGDLVEDVVVQLTGPVNLASDTEATITRRRGGSAAGVAVAAAGICGSARFIGQVGDDTAGRALVGELVDAGVDAVVRHRGRTGSIVVVVDHRGERTMLSDRASCTRLDAPERGWLDDLEVLHVPFYSLAVQPLARTARTLVEWAHQRRITVSVDTSSSAILTRFGTDRAIRLLADIGPAVLLGNTDEAAVLGPAFDPAATGASTTVVHGRRAAEVRVRGESATRVAAHTIAGVRDTTGAGDSFAAGFLVALASGASPADAARAGHDAARASIETAR
ncbi:MAG: carbohydrate kinase family protein [Acidimicrobiales bacterium]